MDDGFSTCRSDYFFLTELSVNLYESPHVFNGVCDLEG